MIKLGIDAVVDNDVPCREFWYSTAKEYLIGIGDTFREAYEDLIEKKGVQQ